LKRRRNLRNQVNMKKLLGIVVLGLLLNGNLLLAEEKIELNCKDGMLFKAGQNPEQIDKTVDYFVDIKNYRYINLNFEPKEIHYLISSELIDGEKAFSLYRFSKDSAQLVIYNRDLGQLGIVTAFRYSEDLYQSTKIKLDNINKQIKNYIPQKNIFGDDYYTVSNLGTQEQEYNKFEIVKSLVNIINNVNVSKITTAMYQCNKI